MNMTDKNYSNIENKIENKENVINKENRPTAEKVETYQTLILEIPPQHQESIEEIKLLSESFECGGIEEFIIEESQVDEILGAKSYSGGELPLDDILFVEEQWRKDEASDSLKLKFYFYGNKAESSSKDFARFIQSKFPSIKSECFESEFEDWNSQWREHFNPIKVSNLLEIVPSWEKDSHSPTSQFPIYIYPGMAFGTGDHATTFLCLDLLSEFILTAEGKSSLVGGKCLDFGCGSGILGIAAAKLKMAEIDFMDIDKNALENCQENLQLNALPGQETKCRIELSEERIKKRNHYNLIFANILENILLEKRDMLVENLSSKGFLILSGILREQMENVEREYLEIPHLHLMKRAFKEDWCALIFKKIDLK